MIVTKFVVADMTNIYSVYDDVIGIRWVNNNSTLLLEFSNTNNTYSDLISILAEKSTKIELKIDVYSLIDGADKIVQTYIAEVLPMKLTMDDLTIGQTEDMKLLVEYKIVSLGVDFNE